MFRSPIILLLLVTFGCTASGRITLPAEPDPFPIYPADACGGSSPSTYVFFDVGKAEVIDPARLERLERFVLAPLRRDGGYLLLEGQMDREEALRMPRSDLGRRRAEWVRNQAVRHGFNPKAIWIRADGTTRSIATAYVTPTPDNRRVDVTLTRLGASCAKQEQQQQLEWLKRNCVEPSVTDKNVCLGALDEMLRSR